MTYFSFLNIQVSVYYWFSHSFNNGRSWVQSEKHILFGSQWPVGATLAPYCVSVTLAQTGLNWVNIPNSSPLFISGLIIVCLCKLEISSLKKTKIPYCFHLSQNNRAETIKVIFHLRSQNWQEEVAADIPSTPNLCWKLTDASVRGRGRKSHRGEVVNLCSGPQV